LIKPIASNPQGNQTFSPINPSGNQCTTQPLLLKTIYQDQNKDSTQFSFNFSSKPLCDCVPFNVIVSSDAAGNRQIATAVGNQNGQNGAEIKIIEKRSSKIPILYFWGECAGGRNPPCRGDVIINMTGIGKSK
jgi:hypothetical protein